MRDKGYLGGGAMRKSWWKKGNQKELYLSSYEGDKKGERIFTLTSFYKKSGEPKKRYTFKSWHMAKAMGFSVVSKYVTINKYRLKY